MSSSFVIVCASSAVGFGLVAGIFLAFSDFVMRSLRDTETPAGVAAMQSINRMVYHSLFYYLLWGMLALAIGQAGYAAAYVCGPALGVALTGSASYVLGVAVVSFAFNVPMNHRLDAMDARRPEVAAYWSDRYLPRWTGWNHVRTATSLAACVCSLVAAALSIASP